MWRIRKANIIFPEVIILDKFLKRYTVVRSPIHEFLQLAQSPLRNQRVELQYSFVTGCHKSFFENILLTDNVMVTVYHLYICGKKHFHKWREIGHFCNITLQTFDTQFQFLPLGSLASLQTQRHLATKVGNTKILPRMQCTRFITVSGGDIAHV